MAAVASLCQLIREEIVQCGHSNLCGVSIEPASEQVIRLGGRLSSFYGQQIVLSAAMRAIKKSCLPVTLRNELVSDYTPKIVA